MFRDALGVRIAKNEAMDLFDSLRSQPLRRTPDRLAGGVCAGLAHRWGISPILVRMGLIVLVPFGGLGFLLYGLGWLLLPDYDTEDIVADGALRSPDAAFAASVILILVGAVMFMPFVAIWGNFIVHRTPATLPVVGLVLLAGVFWVFWRGRSTQPPYGPARPGSAGYGAAQPGSACSQPAPFSAAQGEGATDATAPYDTVQYATTQDDTASYNTAQHGPAPYTTAQYEFDPGAEAALKSAPEFSAPRPTKAPKVKKPALSARAISLILATALVATAIALIAVPGRFAAVLMALSVGLAVVAVGVMYAGVRGLRATWLTALTWLLGLPTAAMLALALIMPTHMITSPKLVLASSRAYDGPSFFSVAGATFKTDTATSHTYSVDTFIHADNPYTFRESDPVIIEVTRREGSYGTSYANLNGWQAWEVEVDGKRWQEPANPAVQYSDERWWASLPVNEGKTLRIFSPAAVANPEDATTIKITYSYGTVLVGSLPAKEGN